MKIVFLEPLGLSVERIEKECDLLKSLGHEVIVYADRCPDKNIERASDADIVIESNMPLRKDFFDACPNLKMLSIAFTGLDHIDLEECEKRGIIVNNAAGYSTEAVAEETICMMIGITLVFLYNMPFAFIGNGIRIDYLFVFVATIMSIVSACQYYLVNKDFIFSEV
jgi:lactate dehydrogenase-like 2-hydroxyacid dehydrogenase